MKINFTSGQYGKAINTYNYSDSVDLTNDILETIQDVWNVGRKYGYVLTVKTDDFTVNFEKFENCIKVYNPTTKSETFLCEAKKMSKGAWAAVWNYVVRNFSVPMTDDALETENIMAFSDYQGEQFAQFEDARQTAEETIKESEENIERIKADENIDMAEKASLIAEEAQYAADAMQGIKETGDAVMAHMSDFTGCSYGFGDAYCDMPTISTGSTYFEVCEEMNPENEFYWWLEKVIGEDEYTDLRATLGHYLPTPGISFGYWIAQ